MNFLKSILSVFFAKHEDIGEISEKYTREHMEKFKLDISNYVSNPIVEDRYDKLFHEYYKYKNKDDNIDLVTPPICLLFLLVFFCVAYVPALALPRIATIILPPLFLGNFLLTWLSLKNHYQIRLHTIKHELISLEELLPSCFFTVMEKVNKETNYQLAAQFLTKISISISVIFSIFLYVKLLFGFNV